jgi:prevent-host-death family protein
MAEIGVRKLKTHASEIVRSVHEDRARYVITQRGHPVALLTPLDEPATQAASEESGAAVWDDLIRLGEEISRSWQSPLSSAELLSELRR